MPLGKYFTIVGSALLALLFACSAYFNDDADDTSSRSALVVRKGLGTEELRLTEDAAPVDRIRETFDVFIPGNARHTHDTARPSARAIKPQA